MWKGKGRAEPKATGDGPGWGFDVVLFAADEPWHVQEHRSVPQVPVQPMKGGNHVSPGVLPSRDPYIRMPWTFKAASSAQCEKLDRHSSSTLIMRQEDVPVAGKSVWLRVPSRGRRGRIRALAG
eukprot:362980-Chlamydomonas_euryale.AAC.8